MNCNKCNKQTFELGRKVISMKFSYNNEIITMLTEHKTSYNSEKIELLCKDCINENNDFIECSICENHLKIIDAIEDSFGLAHKQCVIDMRNKIYPERTLPYGVIGV